MVGRACAAEIENILRGIRTSEEPGVGHARAAEIEIFVYNLHPL